MTASCAASASNGFEKKPIEQHANGAAEPDGHYRCCGIHLTELRDDRGHSFIMSFGTRQPRCKGYTRRGTPCQRFVPDGKPFCGLCLGDQPASKADTSTAAAAAADDVSKAGAAGSVSSPGKLEGASAHDDAALIVDDLVSWETWELKVAKTAIGDAYDAVDDMRGRCGPAAMRATDRLYEAWIALKSEVERRAASDTLTDGSPVEAERSVAETQAGTAGSSDDESGAPETHEVI